MDIFKTAVMTACTAGILSTIVQSAAVGKSGKRMMKLLVNTVVIIGIVRPFIGADLSDEADSLFGFDDPGVYELAEEDLSRYYLANAETAVKYEVKKQLEQREISISALVITCEENEYNEITVKAVKARAESGTDRDKALFVLKELLPGAEVTVTSEENNEDIGAEAETREDIEQ